MTKEYYLRIEGMNLSNFVYDTQDLSTIRGGGLKLLDSVERIRVRFKSQLKPISTGASSGLFRITSDNAKKVKEDIENYINQNPILKHATFVIDIIESDEKDFAKAREELIALNRWQQMQSPSIAIPSQTSCGPCEIDMVRPAIKLLEEYKGKKNVLVSKSVYYRRKYGIKGKRNFFKKNTDIDLEVVNDLDVLTDDKSRGALHHKMAVIYIDGNDFGKKQADTRTPDELHCWDSTIRGYRKEMLKNLINGTKDDPKWNNSNRYRMETLLWGGDELVWVVPAWVGWWTLEFFYQNSAGWPFNQELLTHAAGIVFCHHNAPIHRIKELAHNLAELAKDKSRKESFFAYQRLESFDHIGKDIYAYINDTYGGRVKPVDLVLSGANMLGIAENIRILKNNDFSKSGMYRIVQAIISGSDDVNDIAKKIAKSAEVEKALKNLEGLLNGEKAMWIHLAELWDYII